MQCRKHNFERAVDLCDHCGDGFCRQCLVYAHGDKNPPLCVACALVSAGVRNTATAAISRRELKRRRRELADELAKRPLTLECALKLPEIADPTDAANPHSRGSGRAGERQIEWCV